MLLSELQVGERGRVVSIEGDQYALKRMSDLGFVIGVEIKVLQVSSDSRTYGTRSGMAGLHQREAKLISIEKM